MDRQEPNLTAASALATLRREGTCRVTELAAAEGISQPSMTALAARLTDAGLVHRRTDPADRPAVLLSVAPAGADLLDQRREARAARLTGPLATLAEDDVRAITHALPALTRLAGAPTPPGGTR
nr:MarR family transcriptional regulator [Modestobacter muralis]